MTGERHHKFIELSGEYIPVGERNKNEDWTLVRDREKSFAQAKKVEREADLAKKDLLLQARRQDLIRKSVLQGFIAGTVGKGASGIEDAASSIDEDLNQLEGEVTPRRQAALTQKIERSLGAVQQEYAQIGAGIRKYEEFLDKNSHILEQGDSAIMQVHSLTEEKEAVLDKIRQTQAELKTIPSISSVATEKHQVLSELSSTYEAVNDELERLVPKAEIPTEAVIETNEKLLKAFDEGVGKLVSDQTGEIANLIELRDTGRAIKKLVAAGKGNPELTQYSASVDDDINVINAVISQQVLSLGLEKPIEDTTIDSIHESLMPATSEASIEQPAISKKVPLLRKAQAEIKSIDEVLSQTGDLVTVLSEKRDIDERLARAQAEMQAMYDSLPEYKRVAEARSEEASKLEAAQVKLTALKGALTENLGPRISKVLPALGRTIALHQDLANEVGTNLGGTLSKFSQEGWKNVLGKIGSLGSVSAQDAQDNVESSLLELSDIKKELQTFVLEMSGSSSVPEADLDDIQLVGVVSENDWKKVSPYESFSPERDPAVIQNLLRHRQEMIDTARVLSGPTQRSYYSPDPFGQPTPVNLDTSAPQFANPAYQASPRDFARKQQVLYMEWLGPYLPRDLYENIRDYIKFEQDNPHLFSGTPLPYYYHQQYYDIGKKIMNLIDKYMPAMKANVAAQKPVFEGLGDGTLIDLREDAVWELPKNYMGGSTFEVIRKKHGGRIASLARVKPKPRPVVRSYRKVELAPRDELRVIPSGGMEFIPKVVLPPNFKWYRVGQQFFAEETLSNDSQVLFSPEDTGELKLRNWPLMLGVYQMQARIPDAGLTGTDRENRATFRQLERYLTGVMEEHVKTDPNLVEKFNQAKTAGQIVDQKSLEVDMSKAQESIARLGSVVLPDELRLFRNWRDSGRSRSLLLRSRIKEVEESLIDALKPSGSEPILSFYHPSLVAERVSRSEGKLRSVIEQDLLRRSFMPLKYSEDELDLAQALRAVLEAYSSDAELVRGKESVFEWWEAFLDAVEASVAKKVGSRTGEDVILQGKKIIRGYAWT
jgi:precorrin-6B methylase 1